MISDIGTGCHHCLQFGIQTSHEPFLFLGILIGVLVWCLTLLLIGRGLLIILISLPGIWNSLEK